MSGTDGRYNSGMGENNNRAASVRIQSQVWDYSGGWYDPSIMQWSSPDTIIPDLYQPNDWNRYSYARNNPLRYVDPSGHWPDYWDYLMGATYQFVNDMTMGLYQDIANSQNVCLDCNASDSFMAGQQGGRYASSLVAAAEVVDGTVAVLDGLAAMGGTAAGGATCTLVTGGVCAAVAVPALAVEGVIVVAGSAAVVHGGATLAYIKRNQVQGGGGFFKSAGIDTTNHFWDET